jgi:hypothetical protein
MGSTTSITATTKKILLAGVFGPYGVDDEYGRKENIMELFHNQVTKAQGPASFRFHHRSFGLYFIADNIDADVTVLDFPSRTEFEREVRRGCYDIVGISFITPNLDKAREMARIVRELTPDAEIIIGGHGAAIERIEQLVDCDHVVKGEGIRWLRRHLGQDPDAPIRHPALPSAERMSILGVPLLGTASSLLVPGVGCVNGCSFCSTSHFFGKRYTPYLATGKELFETACRIADARGIDSFFVMDENFLKDRTRALELLDEMERHQRFFRFHIFSSAEAITAFGLDNMVRLGVNLVWIGFESRSRQNAFAKNIDIDPRALVQGLRDRGISVLASGILCMEHHTPENMQDDIDFLVELEADFVQFMLLTPMPVTGLYRHLQDHDLLRTEVPFQEWHGQKLLAYRHPAFPEGAPEAWLKKAFRQDYEQNSSSMLRMVDTLLRGYQCLADLPARDTCLDTRMAQIKEMARHYCLIIPSVARNAVNPAERQRAIQLDRLARRLLGRRFWEHLATFGAISLAQLWKARIKLRGDVIQPKMIRTRYSAGRQVSGRNLRVVETRAEAVETLRLPPAAAASTATASP